MVKLLNIFFFSLVWLVSFKPSFGMDKYFNVFRDSDTIMLLQLNNLYLGIDLNNGGRIVSFTIDDREILSSKQINKRYYGSTFWLAPEKIWSSLQPYDNGEFEIKNISDYRIDTREKQNVVRANQIFSMGKSFIVNAEDTSFIIQYSVTNISGRLRGVAPWEVTRVPTGGIIFSKKRMATDAPIPNDMYPLLNIRDSLSYIWYPPDTSTVSAEKAFLNGDGWIAYVLDDFVFIKQFPVIDIGLSAPDERNIEIYVNKAKTYIELENQGPYTNLASDESLNYTVRWYARKLPSGIKDYIGSRDLINFVEGILKKH